MTSIVLLLAVLVGTQIETYHYGNGAEALTFPSMPVCEKFRDKVRAETESMVAAAAAAASVEARILRFECVQRDAKGGV
jgi:hypothetical protein